MLRILSNSLKFSRYEKINGTKLYHSENVFGFRKKVIKDYIVIDDILQNRSKESNFYRLVTAYREHGHKIAEIDPVAMKEHKTLQPELDLRRYGLTGGERVKTSGILECDKDEITIQEAVNILNNIYANHISAEFTYLEQEEEREWFAVEFEKLQNITIDDKTKVEMAREMLKSQEFDRFLAAKYPGLKRYGGEGAEGMFPFFMELFRLSAEGGIQEIVSAMPHRGRLNILTGLLRYPPAQIFLRLKGEKDYPEHYQASGDVLSHINASVDLHFGDDKVHLTILKNPSHLEAVNPVSVGKTRAKLMLNKDGDYGEEGRLGDKILNLQVHGDAALMGQGVNQETLNMSQTPHFEVGGSIHMVTNNQLGFTTPAERGRSSRYCTDLAKMVSAPVVHVNGDYPELVYKATRLVFEYQRKFRKDVFLDINCYRQLGHNELDDPSFTNPLLYKIIRPKKTVPDNYADKLMTEGVFTEEEKKKISSSHFQWLNDAYKSCDSFKPQDPSYNGNWENFEEAKNQITTWDTGVNLDILTFVGGKSVQYPDTFNVHPTLLKSYVKNRLSKSSEGVAIDWATAETLAFGSLLYEGFNVRISGQDVGRGTFSHRHVMLVDQETNEMYIPLNNLHKDQQGFLEIANSTLSEEAVVGFEYGFSIESPQNLCIWEAQFGDFFNGAQIPVDNFVTCGETKWLYGSGLTMLLPHGYDGAGPDHSSARIERILLQTDSKEDRVDGDNVNLQVCQPSTPAQYFHLLRRQMVRNFRKPLIIIAPKTLLRLAEATSSFSDIAPNSSFMPVIGDRTCDPEKVTRVLITSGKHYYTLLNKKQTIKDQNTALIRLESFAPFPTAELLKEIQKFKKNAGGDDAELFRNRKSKFSINVQAICDANLKISNIVARWPGSTHDSTIYMNSTVRAHFENGNFPNAILLATVWCQEEPRNMGAWSFVKPRFENLIGRKIHYCGRDTLAASAVGVAKFHQKEVIEIETKPFSLEV